MTVTLEDWLHARADANAPLSIRSAWDADTSAAVMLLSDGRRMTAWRVTGNTATLTADIDASKFAAAIAQHIAKEALDD